MLYWESTSKDRGSGRREMTKDLAEQMIGACKLIDPMLNHSPKAITRHVGDKIEMKYCCTGLSGMVIEGDYSTNPDEAMQSLIDKIHEHVFTPTTEKERLTEFHNYCLRNAIC